SSLLMKIKTRIVGRYLPLLKLTSYNSLLRLQAELGRVSNERIRYAHQLEILAEERQRLLERHAALSQQLDAVNEESQRIIGERDTLARQLNLITEDRQQAIQERDALAAHLPVTSAERLRLETFLNNIQRINMTLCD